jgi:hypothetical protein
VLIILDNSTTAMTGHQEHPGTGRTLEHQATGRVVFEDLARSLGVKRVHVVEPRLGSDDFERLLVECLGSGELAVIIVRRPCILIAKQLKEYERQQTNRSVSAHARPRDQCGDCRAGRAGRAQGVRYSGGRRVSGGARREEGRGARDEPARGSVNSDVRFGRKVYSPMISRGEADYLVVLAADQIEHNRSYLRPGGVLVEPGLVDASGWPTSGASTWR